VLTGPVRLLTMPVHLNAEALMPSTTKPFTLLLTCLLLQACGSETQTAPEQQEASDASAADRNQHTLLATLPADDDPADNTFQTLDGRGFDIGLFEGEKVFVNFWATWCAPCIREIPAINNAAAELADEGYIFLFASDEDTDTIDAFLQERQFPGNFIKLNAYFSSYGIGAVPSSWLLDENGDVTQTWAGAYEWDSEEMLAQIRNQKMP